MNQNPLKGHLVLNGEVSILGIWHLPQRHRFETQLVRNVKSRNHESGENVVAAWRLLRSSFLVTTYLPYIRDYDILPNKELPRYHATRLWSVPLC